MTTIRALFPKTRALFSKFRKRAEVTSPLSPSSYAPVNDFLGNRFWCLRISAIVLLTFLKVISRFSLKSNLESKTIIPRCFWDSVKLTVLWFKIELPFWSFWLKITSCACLVGSGLELIFHWNAQAIILAKSLFNSFVNLVIFSATKNSDASSAINFAFYAKSSDKSFMYIRKSSRPGIKPCGSPVSITAREEYCSYSCCFCCIKSLLRYLIIYLICHFL